MRNGLEWDQIMAMATAAYNYFPNMSTKGSAFFLMYGRDPVNKLSSILNAPRRYLCNDLGLPDLEALKNMYQMVAQQLYNSRQCYIKDNKYNKVPDHGILVGDLVLVKDHTAKSFEPKYKEDYRLVQVYGTNALQVSDKRGKLHNVQITNVRCINMTEKAATQLEQIYNNGRTAKNLIPQGLIPDLDGTQTNKEQTGNHYQKKNNQRSLQPKLRLPRWRDSQAVDFALRQEKIKKQNHQDRLECNRTPVDPLNVNHEVNQVQTAETTSSRMQVVLPLTLIGILLLINVFFYFRL